MINAEGGKCNLSIINNFFANIPQNCSAIFAIKSTVPVGTTSKLRNSRKDLKIIHNPEFLTAMNSVSDFKNSERNIFGGDVQNCLLVQEALKIVTPKAVNIIVSSEESESIKYFSNTFLATKVAYFNLVYDLCLKFGINYDNVAYGICSDSRIGFSHSRVPGPDLDRGFGGSCFPKDINSLIDIFKENELDSTILEQIWTYNKKIRNNWDWKKNKSAVLEE
jgi:UDPglucose 6-dehydrogenase